MAAQVAPPQERAEVDSAGSVCRLCCKLPANLQIVLQTVCKPADCAANCLQTANWLPFTHSLFVCRWGKREIHFKLPKEAEPVLSRYLECRNLLAQTDNPCLLVTPTGLAYDLSNYNQRFWEILCTWQAPARFSPQVRQSK